MSQLASHNLYDLIRTMSRSEKRFFKVHIETHSSKHTASYKNLFDRMASQEEYDENALYEEFSDIGQRFPVLKHRLFEKVLESLEVFSRKNDPILQLRNNLSRAHVLYSRGLTSLAENHLQSIIQQAEQEGQWEIQLEALRLGSPIWTQTFSPMRPRTLR